MQAASKSSWNRWSGAEVAGPVPALFLDAGALDERERALHGGGWQAELELAWHQRQRDPARSQALLQAAIANAAREDIELALEPDAFSDPGPVIRWWRRRARLVHAEALYLHARLESAAIACADVLREALQDGDGIACADAQLLSALIQQDRGDRLARTVLLAEASLSARVAGDETRALHAKALHAFLETYSGLAATDAQWGEFMAALRGSPHGCVAALAAEYEASVAFDRSRFTWSIETYRHAAARSLAAGMTRRSIVGRCCLALCLSQLGRHDEALAELADALALARRTGWARSIGTCLLEQAHVLLQQGRLADAGHSLDDAARALQGIEESLSALSLMQYAGELALARGLPGEALEAARRHEQLAHAHSNPLHHAMSLCTQAEALSRLGRAEAALAAARVALGLARLQGNARLELDALMLLAALVARHGDGESLAGAAVAARVDQLRAEALDAAQRIEGFTGLAALRARMGQGNDPAVP